MPRPRDPGEPAEPLRLGTPADSLPPGTPAEPLRLGEPADSLPPADADLIAASRAGDAAAYDTLYRRHVAAAHSLARQLVRNRAEADNVVAETFAKILDLLHRGGGPDDAFRPYLLTAVRRAAYDRHRAERRQLVTDEMETFDRGVPFADPAVADLERTMIARAFASLPERWQAVLWHTEIEGARPADVAPLLGLTANGVAALAYRAREGLRQAYLQMRPRPGRRRLPDLGRGQGLGGRLDRGPAGLVAARAQGPAGRGGGRRGCGSRRPGRRGAGADRELRSRAGAPRPASGVPGVPGSASGASGSVITAAAPLTPPAAPLTPPAAQLSPLPFPHP